MTINETQLISMKQSTMLSMVIMQRDIDMPSRKARADIQKVVGVSAAALTNYLQGKGALDPVRLDKLYAFTKNELIVRWTALHCPNIIGAIMEGEVNIP
jgi:hypothetical protein